jgi:hypothetical protein
MPPVTLQEVNAFANDISPPVVLFSDDNERNNITIQPGW